MRILAHSEKIFNFDVKANFAVYLRNTMICPMCGNRHAPEYTYDLMGNRFIPLLDEIQVKHGDEYNSNIVVICSRNDCNNLANDRFLKTGNLAGVTT